MSKSYVNELKGFLTAIKTLTVPFACIDVTEHLIEECQKVLRSENNRMHLELGQFEISRGMNSTGGDASFVAVINIYRNVTETKANQRKKIDNRRGSKLARNRIAIARIFDMEAKSGEFMIIDSEASHHVVNQKSFFRSINRISRMKLR